MSASLAKPGPGTLVAPGSTLSPPGGGQPKTQDSGPLLTCLLCGVDASPTWLPDHGAWLLGAWVKWRDPSAPHCPFVLGSGHGIHGPPHWAQNFLFLSLEPTWPAVKASGCLPGFLPGPKAHVRPLSKAGPPRPRRSGKEPLMSLERERWLCWIVCGQC